MCCVHAAQFEGVVSVCIQRQVRLHDSILIVRYHHSTSVHLRHCKTLHPCCILHFLFQLHCDVQQQYVACTRSSLLQVANAMTRQKFESEQLRPQWTTLVKTLNCEDIAYRQPFFDKKGANRRLIPLASMVALIQYLLKGMGRSKRCSQNPTELGQRLDWMLPDKILSTVENSLDRESWRIQDFILSDQQRKAYGTTVKADITDVNVAVDD